MAESGRELAVSPANAKELVNGASPDQRKLLRLFAEHQVVSFALARRRLRRTQSSLNGLLGGLTRKYRGVTDRPNADFYVWLKDTSEWAIGAATRKALHDAVEEAR